jgi:hypothetical protein
MRSNAGNCEGYRLFFNLLLKIKNQLFTSTILSKQTHDCLAQHLCELHGDMEIITYIVDGELTHQDSMGSKE